MTDSNEFDGFLQRACELGAVEAKIIDPNSIVIAPWVRLKCQFGCPHYNTRHCCPPYTPTPEQMKSVVDLNCLRMSRGYCSSITY